MSAKEGRDDKIPKKERFKQMRSFKKTMKLVTICLILGVSIFSPASIMIGVPNTQMYILSLLTQTTIKSSSSTLYIYNDYTFTGDYYGNVIVVADNVVVDGNGYSVIGPGSGIGVELQGNNVILMDLTITGWSTGIGYPAVTDCTISGNTLINNNRGIIFQPGSSNNIITGNIIIGASRGIDIQNSLNNIISENTIINNDAGILLWYCANHTIFGNNVENNEGGISLTESSNNIISENEITENKGEWLSSGIWILRSSNNEIFGNNISRNKYGILSRKDPYSFNNIIYHNNFIDNIYHAVDWYPAHNYWHHPNLLEGNYWDNYPGADDGSGTGKHSIAGDGIGDTHIPWPYTDFDYYPFIEESGWAPKVCQRLENLKQMVIDSPNDAWRKPADNRKNAMINKIDEAIVLCENEEYLECYDKVLHDIKPKLTGLKVDEEGNPFGNGVFNNPWVIDQNLQQGFGEQTNLILGLLKSEF
ncbi:MAG: NosD domain-containing protein [Candidatus Hodarchaeota archaeon]